MTAQQVSGVTLYRTSTSLAIQYQREQQQLDSYRELAVVIRGDYYVLGILNVLNFFEIFEIKVLNMLPH